MTIQSFQAQEFVQLLGQRERLLQNVKCLRLAHSGMRLVTYHRHPLGIVQRVSSMVWVSPQRHYFYSLTDAAIDTVGWCWRAYEEGGLPALTKLISRATKEAGKLATVLEAEAQEAGDCLDGRAE